MSRKRRKRNNRRTKRQGLRLGWLLWVAGVLTLAYFALKYLPGKIEAMEWAAEAPPTPSFTPTPYPTPLAPAIAGDDPDLDALSAYMLELINVDRVQHGLQPVVWDALAADVGRLHAEEMAAAGYMSHWNRMGLGPDIRYALSGGRDVIMENVFASFQRYDDGSVVWEDDWAARVHEAQVALMKSPGHRANILTPEHTHVGVGMAYDEETGEFRIAQEFVNHYLVVEDSFGGQMVAVQPGDSLAFGITLMPGATQPLVNLAYEPFPQAMTISELNETSTYESPAAFVDVIEHTVDLRGNLAIPVTIPNLPQTGYYHVRIWVQVAGESVPASNIVISVGE